MMVDGGGLNHDSHAHKEFREPDSSLELNIRRDNITLEEASGDDRQRTQGRSRTRLLADSDDEMKNDDLDDEYEYENTLLMPLEPKIDLHISQSLDPTLSTIATSTSTLPSLDSTDFVLAKVESRSSVANIIQKQQLPEHSKSQQQQSQSNTTVFGDDDADDDDDHLFGDDFMAQFGKDGELDVDSELRQAKKPLFPRRITLLEATNEDDHNDGDDNLGLERLSISQKHRTLSGGPTKTETTTSTVTPMSNTTITSNLFTRPSFDSNRASLSVVDPMASQLSEELLEMSARQQDSMLEDMIQEDERLRAEEAELDDMLLLQMYEQDMMQQEAQQRQKELLGFDINQKRKYASVSTLEPSSSSSASSSSATASKPQHTTFSTIQEVDQFLKESYKVGESSSTRNNTEQSKKTRLGYASTGSNNSKPAEKSTLPNLQLFSKRQRASGIPKYDYTLPPERGSFIKAKNSSGQVFYLPKKVRVDNDKVPFIKQMKESSQAIKPLLSLPIHRMMDELDSEIRLKKLEAINRLEYGDYDQYETATEDYATQEPSERLWVDKYRPKMYTDLMGDERVNREVLSWIKQWDQCVFGRKYTKYTPEYKRQQQYQKQFKDFRKPDPLGRPDKKILLLTGPPGLGKTTLAHVIAKQAGYNVIEVNASDDRTGASVKGKIESVLEIQSILGSNKPNLLVIDEIDGVSSSGGEQSFIKLLVDIASVEVVSKEERLKSAGKKGKKSTKKPLMRPIICICNDQYAPVLRPLRVIAQIYQFKRPSIRSVITRLQQICEIEQLASDTRAFGALYEMTEGDMRSCLNTLQFIKNKSGTSSLASTSSSGGLYNGHGHNQGQGLTLETLNKATIGHKDQSKSLFSVWEELFQAPYARKTRSALKMVEEGREGLVKDDGNAYISRMVALVQTNGEYEKLIQGCFENYTSMIFHDVAMNKVVACGDWLAFYDQLNSRISSSFEYEVGGYVPYVFVNFHRFFAGSVRQKVEYPRTDYESFVTHKANESILQGMVINLPPKTQRHFRMNNFATELLSPFLRILSPYLRPVNKQLIKPEERQILKRLVDVMIHFQLTFVQEKTEDGQFLYRLEPSIEKLGDFSGIGLKNILTSRYAVRQLIAQEIEVELVRRAEEAKEARDVKSKEENGSPSMDASASTITATMSTATLSLSKDGDQEMDILKEEREAVDFFGRVIVKNKKDVSSLSSSLLPTSMEQETKPRKRTRIWYKFNEGFSNAVKAKVYVNELL